MPARVRTYFEPMVGGGALFFELQRRGRIEHAWLNDANFELMCAYRALRDDAEPLIMQLGGMANLEKVFLRWRARPVEELSPVERAARFIYLNKTCFNGIYRVNRAGQFNVPFAGYANPKICDRENLRAAGEALRLVDLTSTDDYLACTESAGAGDLVYFDPPYVPKSATANFTAYTPGGWGTSEHVVLSLAFRHLAERGVAVMLSNADVPLVRELYGDYRVVKTKVRRSVNSDGEGRAPVGEVLVLANCGAA